MSSTNNPPKDGQTSEIDKLIENWILINIKDPQYVKEAKMQARKDFNAAIQSLLVKASQAELAKTCLAGMPELTPRQQDYITQRLAELDKGGKDV